MADKIIILGAGLAGLSAAWHLQRKGRECRIFEKEREAGGLCRSKNIGGFTFDYDGHLLHFKHDYAFRFVSGFLGSNLARHQRSAWIYSHHCYTRYPFQANAFGLPAEVAKECLLGYIRANNNGKCAGKEKTFLDWINHKFGEGIARHFMVPYNTKFWTVPPEKLTCDWLDGFVPIPTLNQIIEGAIRESKQEFGYNARFWYPKKGGINRLALALAKGIKNIHTGCDVASIDLGKKEIKTSRGDKERFGLLISTVPLPEMPGIIKKIPPKINALFRKLKWNSVFNLNLGIKEPPPCRRHWVYFPEKDKSFFRVGFPHNFSSDVTPDKMASLYAEAAYPQDRPIDKNKIAQDIEKDLIKTRIITDSKAIVARDINDIKYGYPIYDKNYKEARGAVTEFLAENDIIPCGRYGSWRYMSMEGAILDGKRAADSL